MSNPSGSPASVPDVDDAVRQALSKGLGAANLQDYALGLGTPTHLGKVGKFNACWSFVPLRASVGRYDVPHNLGVKPVLVQLVEVESPIGIATIPHASASPENRAKWTESSVRVDVFTLVGSLDNCVGRFIVWGP